MHTTMLPCCLHRCIRVWMNTCVPALGVCVCKHTCVFQPHVAASMGLHMPLSASLTCALKQTNFTGDLPVEDNETERCRRKRGRVGASYKGTNEEGGGVEGLFAGLQGRGARRQRDAKHSPTLWGLIVLRAGGIALGQFDPLWLVIHNVNEWLRFL